MATARECDGCRWFVKEEGGRWLECQKFNRVYLRTDLIAREHDPGRCFEAPEKEEPEG